MEVPFIEFDNVISRYGYDQVFGLFMRAMVGKWPEGKTQRQKDERILPMFLKDRIDKRMPQEPQEA